MRLETLHFVEGAEVRVWIVETDDEPDRDLTVLHMIEEGTAVGTRSIGQPTVCSTRPGLCLAGSTSHSSLMPMPNVRGLVPSRRLNRSNSVLVSEPRHPSAKRVYVAQFNSWLIGFGRLAVAADAHVAGGDAFHTAGFVVQHLCGGEAGVDFDAQLLGLLREPTANVSETDDVVAVIVHLRRRRQPEGLFLGEEEKVIFRRRGVQRRVFLLPVGNQLIQRAGSMTAPERMCAPTSAPFSTTQTLTSRSRSAANCLRRIAALNPDGPPPTTTTSNCIDLRAIISPHASTPSFGARYSIRLRGSSRKILASSAAGGLTFSERYGG